MFLVVTPDVDLNALLNQFIRAKFNTLHWAPESNGSPLRFTLLTCGNKSIIVTQMGLDKIPYQAPWITQLFGKLPNIVLVTKGNFDKATWLCKIFPNEHFVPSHVAQFAAEYNEHGISPVAATSTAVLLQHQAGIQHFNDSFIGVNDRAAIVLAEDQGEEAVFLLTFYMLQRSLLRSKHLSFLQLSFRNRALEVTNCADFNQQFPYQVASADTNDGCIIVVAVTTYQCWNLRFNIDAVVQNFRETSKLLLTSVTVWSVSQLNELCKLLPWHSTLKLLSNFLGYDGEV